MIYLIGGPPRCGKTTIARKLAARLHIPWVPADYLGSVAYHFIAEAEYPRKFPLSYRRSLDRSNDWLYSEHTAEEIVEFYRTQARTVWPAIEIFIAYAAHDGQDFVVEGYQIQPGLVSGLKESDFFEQVKAAFVYKSDEPGTIADFQHRTAERDWLLDNTSEEKTFVRVARMIGLYGSYIESEAAAHGWPAYSMDGDFAKQADRVVELLAA